MKKYGVAAIALVVLLSGVFTGLASAAQSPNAGGENGGHNGDRPDDPGTFYLNQSVDFGERIGTDGIYFDGTPFPVDVMYTNPVWTSEVHMMYSKDATVTADWSDNLVLHQWRAGDKVRTEVILKDALDPETTIFTIRANFTICKVDDSTMAYEYTVWEGDTSEGLWVDGVTDAYSAEVNQLGMLLYGYNWDTEGLEAGLYMLKFSLETTNPPTVYDNTEFNDITIVGVEDEGYVADGSALTKAMGSDSLTTYIVIDLLER